jgi:hypothetical protein
LGGEVIVVGADVDLAVLEPLARRPEPLGLLVDESLFVDGAAPAFEHVCK